MQLLVASRNKDKLKEIRTLLADLGFDILSAADVPGLKEIAEDAPTVRDNAVKKAQETAAATRMLTLADDTGLEVDSLNGEPGVRSARYAGEDVTYHENNKKLLERMKSVGREKRGASFRCVVAIADANGIVEVVEGICNGSITETETGGNGFGYDPVFVPDGQVKTFAEMPLEKKNRISHRAKALQKAWTVLSRYKREHGEAAAAGSGAGGKNG